MDLRAEQESRALLVALLTSIDLSAERRAVTGQCLLGVGKEVKATKCSHKDLGGTIEKYQCVFPQDTA